MDEFDRNEIAERWGLSQTNQSLSESDLFEALSRRIEELMNRDFRKFLHSLYRLDIDEEKVANILGTTKGESQYHALASAVLKRELQKAETRKRFEE